MSQLLHAEQTNESEGKARVKAHIEKYGIGRYQTVEVLHNKTKWIGYISEVHDHGFALVHKNSGKQSMFEYAQVKQIKSTKRNPGQNFAFWRVVTGAIVVLSWLVAASSQD